jgi:hypothetical protein
MEAKDIHKEMLPNGQHFFVDNDAPQSVGLL